MTALTNSPITISYNGVTFPTETETTQFEVKPVYDSAGRAVAYNRYTITLRAVIATANQAAGKATDDTVLALRRLLTVPGAAFEYIGVGSGDLVVNRPDQFVRDVRWGPRPDMLSYSPLGSDQAAEVEWRVVVCVPDCRPDAKYQQKISEFCWTLKVAQDTGGYSTRTYAGHLVIPMTRVAPGSPVVPDSADRINAYWEQVLPPPLPGFRRNAVERDVNEDRTRLDFTVVDAEMAVNVPPPGIVVVEMDHTASSSQLYGICWSSTISATYEVERKTSRARPLDYFLDVAFDRIARTRKVKADVADGKPSQAVMLKSLTVAEPEVYGRKCFKASLTYTFFSNLNQIVAASGMWTEVPDNDWNAWKTSLAGTALHPRGNARISVEGTEDAVIDLCTQPAFRKPSRGSVPKPDGPSHHKLKNLPYPDPLASWLYYVCFLSIYSTDHVAELKTLPADPTPPPAPSPGLSGGVVIAPGGDAGSFDSAKITGVVGSGLAPTDPPSKDNPALNEDRRGAGDAPTVVQRRTTPSWYAVLRGMALRAGFPINPPVLRTVANQPAIPANGPGDGYTQGLLATWLGGLPIYFCHWNLRYILPDVPVGDVPMPPSPFEEF